jgi:hypothetical protein
MQSVVHRYRYLPRFLGLLLLVLYSSTRLLAWFVFLLVHGLVFLSTLFGNVLVLLDRHGSIYGLKTAVFTS